MYTPPNFLHTATPVLPSHDAFYWQKKCSRFTLMFLWRGGNFFSLGVKGFEGAIQFFFPKPFTESSPWEQKWFICLIGVYIEKKRTCVAQPVYSFPFLGEGCSQDSLLLLLCPEWKSACEWNKDLYLLSSGCSWVGILSKGGRKCQTVEGSVSLLVSASFQ